MMKAYRDCVKFLCDNLKFDPYKFGLAGELYIWRKPNNAELRLCNDIINKYISVNEECFYVNRKPVYFSTNFDKAIGLISDIPGEYLSILQSDISREFKRYLLFSLTEYVMHSVCKLQNVCFIHKSFREQFYKALKAYLMGLSHLLVSLLFEEQLNEMKVFDDIMLKGIVAAANELNITTLREHVEMDNKMLLLIGYMLYLDCLEQYDLILSPLLGAAQIPTVFNALCSYLNKHGYEGTPNNFDYIKYSTYEEDGADLFITMEEQLELLGRNYTGSSKVLIIDESIGTGTTVLTIKKVLEQYFAAVDTASIEYRWDKKIIWNTERDWFKINDLDYVTPVSYRHYIAMGNKIADLKNEASTYEPYVPHMIYDDVHYHIYIANKSIKERNKMNMDIIFERAKIAIDLLYTTETCQREDLPEERPARGTVLVAAVCHEGQIFLHSI